MAKDQDDSFNASQAEVFDALGHPTRMRLLQTLSENPLPFSELKRAAGLESNGLLTFHLGRLRGLVRLNPEGAYALTDEGREALRMIEVSRTSHAEPRPARPAFHPLQNKAVLTSLVVILVALVAVSALAGYYAGNSMSHTTTMTTVSVTTKSVTSTSVVPVSCSTPVNASVPTGMDQVFQMSPGSVGVICINYQFASAGNFSLEAPGGVLYEGLNCVVTSSSNGSPVYSCDLRLTPSISLFDHAAGQNVTVAYLVQSDKNATGVYWFGGVCGPVLIPFAVGKLPASLSYPFFVLGCLFMPNMPSGATVTGVTNMNISLVPYR